MKRAALGQTVAALLSSSPLAAPLPSGRHSSVNRSGAGMWPPEGASVTSEGRRQGRLCYRWLQAPSLERSR